VLERVVTLGRASDSVSPTTVHADIGVDSRGRFYTWSHDRYEILVYARDGTLLARIGRRGEGPGELSRPGTRLAVTAGDSLFAMLASRFVVFDSTGRPVRTVPVTSAPFSPPVPLPNGDVIVAAPFRSLEAAGRGLHVLSPRGEVLRSFGGDGSFDARCLLCVRYRISPARHVDAIWAIPANRYEIRKINYSGHDISVMRVEGSWYVPSTDSMRPNISVVHLREDVEGRLWVFAVLYPSPPQQNGRGVASVPESVRASLIGQAKSVIDVFDPTHGVLIASQSYTGAFIGFGDGFVAKAHESPVGVGSVEIFRVRLVSQN
jgi:hypothetical protein